MYATMGTTSNTMMPGTGNFSLTYAATLAKMVGSSVDKKLKNDVEYQNLIKQEDERKPEYEPVSTKEKREVKANDFTIRTHPKDTIKIAGGTKFGEETNQLLEKLIDTVNNSETNKLLQVLVDTVRKGGNVYLDSRKVGESLVLGYSSQ
jgi:hypothetical protein